MSINKSLPETKHKTVEQVFISTSYHEQALKSIRPSYTKCVTEILYSMLSELE